MTCPTNKGREDKALAIYLHESFNIGYTLEKLVFNLGD